MFRKYLPHSLNQESKQIRIKKDSKDFISYDDIIKEKGEYLSLDDINYISLDFGQVGGYIVYWWYDEDEDPSILEEKSIDLKRVQFDFAHKRNLIYGSKRIRGLMDKTRIRRKLS